MDNKPSNQETDLKKEAEKEKPPVKTIIVEGFKPFGADSPMPTDRREIKRQLGFKKY